MTHAACLTQTAWSLRTANTGSPFTPQLSSFATSSLFIRARLPYRRCLHATGSSSAQMQPRSAADSSARSQASKAVSLTQPARPETSTEKRIPVAKKLGTLWGLLVLAVAYVHHSTTGCVLGTPHTSCSARQAQMGPNTASPWLYAGTAEDMQACSCMSAECCLCAWVCLQISTLLSLTAALHCQRFCLSSPQI